MSCRGNVGYHREREFAMAETPIIDALVRDGCEIDRHYAYPVCSPARSSIHTGRFPAHVNLDNSGPTLRNPADPISGYQVRETHVFTCAARLSGIGLEQLMTQIYVITEAWHCSRQCPVSMSHLFSIAILSLFIPDAFTGSVSWVYHNLGEASRCWIFQRSHWQGSRCTLRRASLECGISISR